MIVAGYLMLTKWDGTKTINNHMCYHDRVDSVAQFKGAMTEKPEVQKFQAEGFTIAVCNAWEVSQASIELDGYTRP